MQHDFTTSSLSLIARRWRAAGCGSSGAPPAPADRRTGPTNVTLALDWYPNPDHVGIYAGIDHGFFARAGLDVTPLPPADVSDPIKLVAAGRADLGISYEPELFFAQQQAHPGGGGGRARTHGAELDHRPHRPRHSHDRRPARQDDRRGRKHLDHRLCQHVLKTAGIPADSVHLVTVGFNLLPALLSGRVDAIAGGFQNIEGIDGAGRGLHPVVFPVDHYGVPRYDELVVVANRPRMKNDPAYRKTVRKFVAALTAATA